MAVEKRIAVFDLELRSLEEQGRFTGYASVFGVVDAYGTVFDKGAFKKTIKEHKGKFPLVWMHNVEEPIGSAMTSEDEHGLWIEGQLDLDVPRGQWVYSGMKNGYITQMSHSFSSVPGKVETVEAEDKSQIPHFKEVRLYEISPVTSNFAANEQANIEEVRTVTEDDGDGGRALEGLDDFEQRLATFETLYGEPEESTRTEEPLTQAGMIHLRALESEAARLERVLTGGD